jgi:lysophospholipase L1-like esterase
MRDVFQEQSARIRRLIASDSTGGLLELDPLLGWRYRAGHRDSINTINAQGLRGSRTYAAHAAPGVLRVAALGDSFVYGNEVADADAWPAQAERLFPKLEVLNYGVGGYGVDQAYLRFRAEGMALSPRIVLIGFTTDDLRRVVNVYRRFISNREYPLVKPRFRLEHRDDLVLVPNAAPSRSDYERYLEDPRAVIKLGTYDYWYHSAIYEEPLYDYSATVRLVTNVWIRVTNRYLAPDRMYRHGEFNPASTAFRIQLALFERFVTEVEGAGARPIVALLPDRQSVGRARQGGHTLFEPLVEALAARGIPYIDLTRAFVDPRAAGAVDDWFMNGGHYSPAGNAIVARWLGQALFAAADSTAIAAR